MGGGIMMNEMNGRLAYVVGDSYSELSRLPGVLTATQFFKGVLEGSLPLNLTWMIGQGITSVEQNLLQLCKTYRSEIRFYGDEEIQMVKKVQEVVSKSLFSKFSQIISAITHRLGLSR